MKISVLGSGAWGTALAGHLSARHDTLLWTRDFTLTDRHKNLCIVLPPTLHYEKNLEVAILHSAKYGALCIIATPVSGLRMICNAMRSYGCIPENIVWVCKGFEDKTQILPHQIVTDELPEQQSKGVLSGPGFAFEVAKNLPVELMIASKSTACQQHTIDAFHYGMMRIYASNDVVGVEIGGAVKNVLAIAIGIADGLNLGLSIRAALITRGLAEMSSLGVMLGGRLETFTGLTGLGDLILTATSDISRNRTVGLQLAEGRALEDILRNLGHVAEGVRCAQTVLEIAHEQSVDMPIINAVCSVLFNGVRPIDAIHKLLFQKIYV